MARLMVLYDPDEKISGLPNEVRLRMGVMEASLSLGEDPTLEEIEDAAKRLMALLVEQL